MRYILPLAPISLFLVPVRPKFIDYKGTRCDSCSKSTTNVANLVNNKLKQYIEMGLCDECAKALVKSFPEGVNEIVLHNLINGAHYSYKMYVDPKLR